MPIASRKPTAELKTQPQLPKIQTKEYKSIVYDDNHVPLHSLIAYIEGAPWSVDYYSQVVNEHNDLREVDAANPGIYQQYHRVLGLEIRVSSALTSSYDADRAITAVSGNGLMYPFLIPNVSDYFITDTSDNQKAIFRITQVERKTFNLDSAHAIEYELVGYVSNNQEIFESLQTKTIRSYTFSKERLIEGLSPTLKTEEYDKVTNLKTLYRELVRYYFKMFFDRKYFTLVLPGQTHAFYDPYLMSYLMQIVDSFDAPEIRSIKQLPTDEDIYMKQSQFWELLLNRDYNGRLMCNQEMGFVHKHLFSRNTWLGGLLFTNVDYVTYPHSPDTSLRIGDPNDVKTLSLEDSIATTGFKGGLHTAIDNQYVTDVKTYVLKHEVLHDNKYVLSASFYNDLPDQSVLEILVKDYLKKQSLDLDMLYALCNQYRSWNRLDQFYYGPILMTLIKQADKAQYS